MPTGEGESNPRCASAFQNDLSWSTYEEERLELKMAKKEVKTDLWVASQLDKCKFSLPHKGVM